MMNKDILVKLLQERRYKSVKDVLDVMNAVDIASLLGEFDDKELALAFRLIPKEKAADVFANMESSLQSVLVEALSEKELKEILNDLYMDDTVDLLEELPANLVTRILDASGPKERETINKLLNYPEDSAGSIMTTEYVDLKPYLTVGQALTHIKKTGIHKETIYTCYVTSKDKKLVGVVTVKELLLASKEKTVAELMTENVIFAYTDEDREETVNRIRDYGLMALPVVDKEQRIVGIVTIDDALDVLTEESEEDFSKMAGVVPTETPYIKTSVLDLWKARIPWLLLLMISATFTGQIISSFESALAAAAVLTAYIPMLMDTGGNCGSQASVTVIRGLSLGEIEFSDIFKVIWKEVRVAVTCGVTLAACNFVKLMLVDRLVFHNPITMPVAAVICGTMVCTVLCAKVVGCTLPLLAKKVGFDPAVMASPFITTIVDALSMLIYFFFATWILPL